MAVEIKEKNYICSDSQLNEIHKAIIQEFEAVSKKQSEQKIRLYNGLLQQDITEKYLYKFEAPNDPEKVIEPDKPYILSTDGKTVDGSIYSITEKNIEIELKEYYGQLIPSLDVITDLRILLDLIDRRIVLFDKEPSKFKVNSAKFLFDPDSSTLVPALYFTFNHTNRKDKIQLNSEQIQAIRSSLENKLTIIWGPPGTGKTKTLLGVIAELLANNKKVLFASNTNNAIDGLLQHLIEKEKSPYEIFKNLNEEGKIIRIGSQTSNDVKRVFSPKAVLEQKSEKIIIKLRELENYLRKEVERLRNLEDEMKSYNKAIELQHKISKFKNDLNQISPSNDYLLQIQTLENNKDLLLLELSKYELH